MSLIKTVNFNPLGDERGSLVALEGNKNVPFSIRRVYCIFGTKKSVSRGFHAHKNLKQVVVCVAGSCRFVLDNGVEKEDVVLDSPSKGLIVDKMIWREMYDFTDDCVLIVLADEVYDESDYIRDYQAFLKAVL